MPVGLSASSRLLFIGDSITDCGRRDDPDALGNGYVRLIRDYLLAKSPATAPQVINRGISGNKVTDLAARWDKDVLRAAPDVLSIKVGINDVWHGLENRGNGVPIGKFKEVYERILRQTQSALPRCALVLCEPSVIWPPQPATGNEILKPYVAAVRELAAQFHAAVLVPLHSVFEQAREKRPDIDWAPDGVHPSASGHMLIARAWLAATGLI